jgi:hypothetical protein
MVTLLESVTVAVIVTVEFAAPEFAASVGLLAMMKRCAAVATVPLLLLLPPLLLLLPLLAPLLLEELEPLEVLPEVPPLELLPIVPSPPGPLHAANRVQNKTAAMD